MPTSLGYDVKEEGVAFYNLLCRLSSDSLILQIGLGFNENT